MGKCEEIIVDNFAGGGGASTGISLMGLSVAASSTTLLGVLVEYRL